MTTPQSEEEVLIEKEVVRLTRIAHPQDLGTPTSILEKELRQSLHTQATHLRAEIRREIEGKRKNRNCFNDYADEIEEHCCSKALDDILALPSLNEGK